MAAYGPSGVTGGASSSTTAPETTRCSFGLGVSGGSHVTHRSTMVPGAVLSANPETSLSEMAYPTNDDVGASPGMGLVVGRASGARGPVSSTPCASVAIDGAVVAGRL